LLEGSDAKISKAIIVKVDPLREGETEIQTGFVEMWHFKNGRVIKDGGRKVIFTTIRYQVSLLLTPRFRTYSHHH